MAPPRDLRLDDIQKGIDIVKPYLDEFIKQKLGNATLQNDLQEQEKRLETLESSIQNINSDPEPLNKKPEKF